MKKQYSLSISSLTILLRNVSQAFCFLGLILCSHSIFAGSLEDRLPPVVGEKVWQVSVTPGERADVEEVEDGVRWTFSADGSLEDGLLIDPKIAEGQAERLRFRVRGSGPNDRLVLMAYHSPSNRWIDQAEVQIYNLSWVHLEIPATNNFHRFHKSIEKLALIVRPGSGSAGGWVEIKDVVLVAPELIKDPIKPKKRISPAFTTWGGANPEQLRAIAEIGSQIHLVTIDFPEEGKSVEDRISWLQHVLPVMKEKGIVAGMHFFAQAPIAFTETHRDWFTILPSGEPYIRPGGNFLSPWHPDAKTFYRKHMLDCLNVLKESGTLEDIEVVFLSPGEEGEISFMWDSVHAHGPYAIAAYHAYLRKLYKNDIDLLNVDWESHFKDFESILPPTSYRPDREHWVFTDFYRYSMLKKSVFLADTVLEVYTPEGFLWLPHSIGTYPQRYYSGRYPLFYVEQLTRLGIMDYAHITALNWQEPEDVEMLNSFGVTTIGEVDVVPSLTRLNWTFDQSKRYELQGVYIGAGDVFTEEDPAGGFKLNSLGQAAKEQIHRFEE